MPGHLYADPSGMVPDGPTSSSHHTEQPADAYAAQHLMPAVQGALAKILDAMPATDHATEFVRYLREGGERQRDFIYSRVEPKSIEAMVSLDAFSNSTSQLYRSQMAVCRAHHATSAHGARRGGSRAGATSSTPSEDHSNGNGSGYGNEQHYDEEVASFFNKVPVTIQLLPRGKAPPSATRSAQQQLESSVLSVSNSRILSPLDTAHDQQPAPLSGAANAETPLLPPLMPPGSSSFSAAPSASQSPGAAPLSFATGELSASPSGAAPLTADGGAVAVTRSGKSVKYQLPSPLANLGNGAGSSGHPPQLQGFNYGIPIPTADTPKTPNKFSNSPTTPSLSPTARKGSGSAIVSSPLSPATSAMSPNTAANIELFNAARAAARYPLPQCCVQTGALPLFGLHCPNKTDLEDTFLHIRHALGVTRNISLVFLLQSETVYIDKVPYAGNKWRALCHAYGTCVPFRPLEEAVQSAILDERLSAEGRRVAHHDCDTLDDILEGLELKAGVTSTHMQRLYCPDLSEHPHPLLQLSFVDTLNEIVFSRVLPHAPDAALVVVDFAPSRMGLGLVQTCLATAMQCDADRFVPHMVLRRRRNGDEMLEGDREDDAAEGEESDADEEADEDADDGNDKMTFLRTSDTYARFPPSSSNEEDLLLPIRTTTFARVHARHEALVRRRAQRDEHRRATIARYRKELLFVEQSGGGGSGGGSGSGSSSQSPPTTNAQAQQQAAAREQSARLHEQIAAMQRAVLDSAARRQAADANYERFKRTSRGVAAVVIQATVRARLVARHRMAQAALKASKTFGIDLKALGGGGAASSASPPASPTSAPSEEVVAAEKRRMLKALTPVRSDVAAALKNSTTIEKPPPQKAVNGTLAPKPPGSPSAADDEGEGALLTAAAAQERLKGNGGRDVHGAGALFAPMRLTVAELVGAYGATALAWDPPFTPLVCTRPIDEWGWSLRKIPKEVADDVDSEDESFSHARRDRVTAAAERDGVVRYDPRFRRRGAVAFVNITRKRPLRVDPYRSAMALMRASGCDAAEHLDNISGAFAGCGGMQRRGYRTLTCLVRLVMNAAYCALRAHRHPSVARRSLEQWLLAEHGTLMATLEAPHFAALCVPRDGPPAISNAGPAETITVAGGDWTVVAAKSLPEGAPVPWRAVPLLQQHRLNNGGSGSPAGGSPTAVGGEERRTGTGDSVQGAALSITSSLGPEYQPHRKDAPVGESPRHITFLTAGNLTARSEATTTNGPQTARSAGGAQSASHIGIADDDDNEKSTKKGALAPYAAFATDEALSDETVASGYSFFHYSIPVFAFAEPMATEAMRGVARNLIFYAGCTWLSTSRSLITYVNDEPFAFVNRAPMPEVILPPLAKIRVRSPPKPLAQTTTTVGGVTAPVAPQGGRAGIPLQAHSPTAMSPKPPADRFTRISSIRVVPGGAAASPGSRLGGTLSRKNSEMRTNSSLGRRGRRRTGGEEAQVIDDINQLSLYGGDSAPSCDTAIPTDEAKAFGGAVSWLEAERRAAVALKAAGDVRTGKLQVYEPAGCADVLTRRGACTLEGCELRPTTVQVFEPIAMAAAKAAAEAKAREEAAAKKAREAAAAASVIIAKPNDPNAPEETNAPLYLQPVRRRSKPEVVFVGEQRTTAEYSPADEAGSSVRGSGQPSAASPSCAVVAAAPSDDSASFSSPSPTQRAYTAATLTPVAPTTAKSAFAAARMSSVLGRPPPPLLDPSATGAAGGGATVVIPPDMSVRSYADACREHILRRHPMEGTFSRVPVLLGTNGAVSAMSAVVEKVQTALPASCVGVGLDTPDSVPVLVAALIAWCVREEGLSQKIMDEVSEKLRITERVVEGSNGATNNGGSDGCSAVARSDDGNGRSYRDRSIISMSSTSAAVNVRFLRKDGSLANVSQGDLTGLRFGGSAESEVRYVTMTNAPPALLPLPLIDVIEAAHGAAIRECGASLDDSRAFVDCLLARANLSALLKLPLLEMAPFVEQLRAGEASIATAADRFLVQKRLLEAARAAERYVLLLLLHIYLTSTHGSVERQRQRAAKERGRRSIGAGGGSSPRRKLSEPPAQPDTTVYTTISFAEFMRTVPFAAEMIRDIDAIAGLRTVTPSQRRSTFAPDKDEMEFLGTTAGPDGLVEDGGSGGFRATSGAFSGELSAFLPDPHYLLYSDHGSRWAANENYVHRML